LFEAQGASRLEEVYTAGGGAANTTWTEMRSRILGVRVAASPQVVLIIIINMLMPAPMVVLHI
jgi:sugar (pentulose or hexulose) kinase